MRQLARPGVRTALALALLGFLAALAWAGCGGHLDFGVGAEVVSGADAGAGSEAGGTGGDNGHDDNGNGNGDRNGRNNGR